MLVSTRTYSFAGCLLILALFTACSSFRDQAASKNLLSVSFETYVERPPFSSSFEITKFTWHPAGASSEGTYLYTRQLTCLEGKSTAPQGEVSPGHKIFLCFTINEPPPYASQPQPPPIHTGTFPVARVIPPPPGEKESYYLNEVSGVSLEVTEYYPGIPAHEWKFTMQRETAHGSLEITVSEKNRLAGKVDYKDANVSITGSFDCPRHRK